MKRVLKFWWVIIILLPEEDKDYFNSLTGVFNNPYIVIRTDEQYAPGVEIHEV